MENSAASSSSSSSPPPTVEHPAYLDDLHVTISCKTPSDALLASLSVALSDDLNSTVLDAFLKLFQDPSFSSKNITFQTAQDTSRYISEQRKRIAQKRSLAVPGPLSRVRASLYGNVTKNVYGGVPQLIVDMAAQQLASEMMPLSDQVDWDSTIYNVNDERCPREQDLLNMALVHRTWTTAAMRALRSRAKVVGSRNLQSYLRSPRMGPWLREFYYVESLENENASEMVKLLEHLVRSTPNLRKLAIRTWWRLGSQNIRELDGVIRELGNMQHLESLWLFTNRSHVTCLPTLFGVLPRLRSLQNLYLRNWMAGDREENTVNTTLQNLANTSSSAARLTTLSFVDGGMTKTASIFLPWLLRDCPLTNLEVHTKDFWRVDSGSLSPMFQALLPFLPKIRTLRMHYSSVNDNGDCRTEFLRACASLRNLSIIIGLHHTLNDFPESMENLHVHYSTIWPVSGQRLYETLEPQRSLTKLRTITVTKDPIDELLFEGGVLDGDDREAMEAAWHLEDMERLCEERQIELAREHGFVSFDQLSAL